MGVRRCGDVVASATPRSRGLFRDPAGRRTATPRPRRRTRADLADLAAAAAPEPTATWTYLVVGRSLGGLEEMLAGAGTYGVAGAGALAAGPLLAAWGPWRWVTSRPR
jgi:hypothetical protein